MSNNSLQKERDMAVAALLKAKSDSGMTFEELGKQIGRSAVWTASALFGQATLSTGEATLLASALEIDPKISGKLQEVPMRGSFESDVPRDPTLYRFYEIIQVYGPALKAVIHEMFGDGILSAIDFEMHIERKPDPKGERVVVTLDGKFLPYRKW